MACVRASVKTTSQDKGYAKDGDDDKGVRAAPVRSLAPGAALVHATALAWYLRVWLWHFTPAAAHLPGSRGFGWFFKYLTFYSYTLQLGQLIICCCADFTKENTRKGLLDSLADDVSCAVFGMANVVTLMYYGIDAATQDLVEGGVVERPQWLGMSVHLFNSMTVWVDLLVAHPRTFSRRSQFLSLGLVLTYTSWILICSHFNHVFPYPFLNKLPWPQGFCGVAAGALVLFYFIFHLGRHLSALLLRIKSSALAASA